MSQLFVGRLYIFWTGKEWWPTDKAHSASPAWSNVKHSAGAWVVAQNTKLMEKSPQRQPEITINTIKDQVDTVYTYIDVNISHHYKSLQIDFVWISPYIMKVAVTFLSAKRLAMSKPFKTCTTGTLIAP